MDELKHYRDAFGDCVKFLTFRADDELWDRLGYRHFLIGFITTWLVGIGRNWDFPEAPFFAKTGLPSVAYIFVLSFILFLMSWPVSNERLNYWKILTLISMTAAPGLVYAIPVEQMMPLESAQAANLWFLTLVAGWRVALAYFIFIKAGQNGAAISTSIILLPICIIIVALVGTGRAGYVIQIMGGLNRPENVNTGVDNAIATLYCLAWPVGVVAAIIWLAVASSASYRR